jgi:hypothetical protein
MEVKCMVTQRLEVRLDSDRKRKLQEIAGCRRVPVSDVIRSLIDEAYEDAGRAHRLLLVEQLGRLEVGENPDPDALVQELDSLLDLPALYSGERLASRQSSA